MLLSTSKIVRVPAAGSGDIVVMALIYYETFQDRTQNFHILLMFFVFYKF